MHRAACRANDRASSAASAPVTSDAMVAVDAREPHMPMAYLRVKPPGASSGVSFP